MLTLTAREGHSILLGPPANPTGRVWIERARGGAARLSFDVPMVVNHDTLAEQIAAGMVREPGEPHECTVRVFADWEEESAAGIVGGIGPEGITDVRRVWLVDFDTPFRWEHVAPSGRLPETVHTLPQALAFVEELVCLVGQVDWRPGPGCVHARVPLTLNDLTYAATRLKHEDLPVVQSLSSPA